MDISSLVQYTRAVRDSVNSGNGAALAELFSLHGPLLYQAASSNMRANQQQIQHQAQQGLQTAGEVGKFAASFISAASLYHRGEAQQAFELFCGGAHAPAAGLFSYCRSADDAWVKDPYVAAAQTVKQLGEKADEEMRRRGKSSKYLSCAVTLLQGAYGQMMSAKGPTSVAKKQAAFMTGCIIIKALFKLNMISNCGSIRRALEGPSMVREVRLDDLPKAYITSYKYHSGRLAVYEEDLQRAATELQQAFQLCKKDAQGNVRRILRYLIPAKLLLGELPSDRLLERYQLQEYREVKAALQAGDVGLLSRALQNHQLRFIRCGTYLMLEKLQLAVYRRLFKKCQLVHAQEQPAKAAQVPLVLFQACLAAQGVQRDMDDVLCTVANLIFRGFIKGYISHKLKVVVVSKENAFPGYSPEWFKDPY